MRTLLATVGLLLLLTASASASSLTVLGAGGGSGFITVTYTAGGGEHNAVNVTRDPTDVIVEDPGALISVSHWAGEPTCTVSSDLHSVRCPHLGGIHFGANVTLGDQDDVGSVAAGFATATAQMDGGTGNDTMTIDSGTLNGGAGDDTMTMRGSYDWNYLDGGPGNDHELGGPGVDFLLGGPGSDVLDGRGGNDTIHDGSATDPDAESDTLIGGAGADALYSHGGVDQLQGDDGDDYLFASDAESGAPTFVAAADAVDCGAGTDYYRADAADALTACEQLYVACVSPPYPGRPAPPCGGGSGGGGGAGGGGAATVVVPAPPAAVAAPSAPAPAAVVAPPGPLVKLALDEPSVRLPLKRAPRAVVALFGAASVTLTLAYEADGKVTPISGHVSRQLGAGATKVALDSLFGTHRQLSPGLYWITLTAHGSDGGTTTTRTALRLLRPKIARRA